MNEDREWFLADGTRLADVADDRLEELKHSFGKYMEVLGRTPHYRRKNMSNIQLFERDRSMIESEQLRRKSLNRVSLGGWEGFIKHVYSRRLLWVVEAEKYDGRCPDDAIPCLTREGKLHRCPAGREPTHYALEDELYELCMESFHAPLFGSQAPPPSDYPVTVRLPGRIFKRLVHNAGSNRLLEDPLQTAPWRVLDSEVER